jgi:hypothetical protein
MALTPEQEARVQYLVHDDWVNEAPEDSPEHWRDFDRMLNQMSAEELHSFVDRMNWDGGGVDRLERVFAHPKCDRGTVLLAYWRAEPVFYLKYDTRERVEKELWPEAVRTWDMLRRIEQRLAEGKYLVGKIAFNPTNDRGRDRTQPRRKKLPPRPVFGEVNGQLVQIGEEESPAQPAVDTRSSLPAVVFEVISG